MAYKIWHIRAKTLQQICFIHIFHDEQWKLIQSHDLMMTPGATISSPARRRVKLSDSFRVHALFEPLVFSNLEPLFSQLPRQSPISTTEFLTRFDPIRKGTNPSKELTISRRWTKRCTRWHGTREQLGWARRGRRLKIERGLRGSSTRVRVKSRDLAWGPSRMISR